MTLTPMRRHKASSAAASKSWRARADLLGDLGADAGDAQQFPARRLQDAPGRPEPLEQRLAGLRPDARHHRQMDQVEQSLIVV